MSNLTKRRFVKRFITFFAGLMLILFSCNSFADKVLFEPAPEYPWLNVWNIGGNILLLIWIIRPARWLGRVLISLPDEVQGFFVFFVTLPFSVVLVAGYYWMINWSLDHDYFGIFLVAGLTLEMALLAGKCWRVAQKLRQEFREFNALTKQ